MNMPNSLLLLAVSALMLNVSQAWAACADPEGEAGQIIYNEDYAIAQLCNGGQWLAWGSGAANQYEAVVASANSTLTGTTTDWSSKVYATCPAGYVLSTWALTESRAKVNSSGSSLYHYCRTDKEDSTRAYVQILNDANNANFFCTVTAFCSRN